MRWTADQFWRERKGVAGTNLFTTNDVLRATFLAGATEAEVSGGDNQITVRVAGMGRGKRRRFRKQLQQNAPIIYSIHVVRLKGTSNG